MPKPKRVDGRVVWDRLRHDVYFNALPGDDDNLSKNPWDRL